MADRIVISGIKPYDGEYEIDLEGEPLTTLEWRWVKKISGYLPLTMETGLRGGDPDVFIALAVVAMGRAGKIRKEEALAVADRLAEAPFDGAKLTYVGDEEAEGDDAGPPALMTETGSPTQSGGESSRRPSDPPENAPSPTGLRSSETPTSDPESLPLRSVI